MERVNEVCGLKKTGYSNREISRHTGLNRSTIGKYLNESFNPVHAFYGKKKNGKLTPYIKEIDEYLEKGIVGSDIERKIREKEYDGSLSNIRHYITDWKRRRKQYFDKSREGGRKTETIERKNIFKLLYHPIEKVNSICQRQFERICKEYPCFEKVYNIIWEFKAVLTGKNADLLNKWIEKGKKLCITEIDSFVCGLERDLDAVRNAIPYEYNNGLAEGRVNKLKVIKRIMYDRCSFDTLRAKTLWLEKRLCK